MAARPTLAAGGGGNPPDRDAVTFNSTLLTNPGGIANMPDAATNFIVAFNFRFSSNTQSPQTVLLCNALSANGFNQMEIVLAGNGATIALNNAITFFRAYPPVIHLGDGLWHSFAGAMDSAQGLCTAVLDGGAIPMTIQAGSSVVSADFTQETYVGAHQLSRRSLTSPYVGDMADLTLWAGAYLDVSDPGVLANFYDSGNEVAERVGPTGWRTLEAYGLHPQLCLSGPASQFGRNLAAGNFTFSPPGYTDTSPTSTFTITSGGLVTAASDPWTD